MVDKLTILCILKLIYQLPDKGVNLFLNKIYTFKINQHEHDVVSNNKSNAINILINKDDIIKLFFIQNIHIKLFCVGDCDFSRICNRCKRKVKCFICNSILENNHYDLHNTFEVDKNILRRYINNGIKIYENKFFTNQNSNYDNVEIMKIISILSYEDTELLKKKICLKIYRIQTGFNKAFVAANDIDHAIILLSKHNDFIKNIQLRDIHIALFCKNTDYHYLFGTNNINRIDRCYTCNEICCFICKAKLTYNHFTKHDICKMNKKILEQYIREKYIVEEM